MRTMRLIAAFAVLAIAGLGLAVAQPQNFTDPGLEPTLPLPVVNDLRPVGSLGFYPDRTSFQAAHPGLPLEDFSGTLVSDGGVVWCLGPLDSSTNDDCFATGGVVAGFDLTIVDDEAGDGDTEYVVLNHFLSPCVAIGPNAFIHEPDWNFSPPAGAVAFDFYSELGGNTYVFEMFGPGGSLGSTPFSGVGGGVAAFFGVDTVDPGGITRIEVREDFNGSGDLFCNLEFGDSPVPVMLQSVGVE